MTRFSTLILDDNGNPIDTNIREISQDAMRACPHFIMVAEHYRADGSCRCNDAEHNEMLEWGYKWHNGQWESTEE